MGLLMRNASILCSADPAARGQRYLKVSATVNAFSWLNTSRLLSPPEVGPGGRVPVRDKDANAGLVLRYGIGLTYAQCVNPL